MHSSNSTRPFPEAKQISVSESGFTPASDSTMESSPIACTAQKLGAQAIADLQGFLLQDDDDFPTGVSDHDSSSDSLGDESYGDATSRLKQLDTSPENFRALFLGPQGFKSSEARKLINAMKMHNEMRNSMLFDVRKDSSKAKGPVFKPLDEAKNMLTTRYANKYGVFITPATQWHDSVGKANVLCEALREHGNNAFGLVFAGVNSSTPIKVADFKGHVLPYLVQRCGQEIHLIELNSGVSEQGVLDGLFECLPTLLSQHSEFVDCEVKLHQLGRINVPGKAGALAGRQVDGDSCHTDAIQILKDALVFHKSQALDTPIWQLFPERAPVVTPQPCNARRTIGLPPELMKTAQYPAFVAEMSQPSGLGAVQAHRDKYSAGTSGASPDNQFLLIKALRNSAKIIKDTLINSDMKN